MKIRWGHFSDLHFQFKNYDTDDLRSKLLGTIEQDSKLDYLFITGDIFYKGDYSKEDEIVQFIRTLAQKAQCDDENVIICAGNHDLKRTRARAKNLEAVIEESKENDNLDFNGYTPIIVDKVCDPFVKMCKKINKCSNVGRLHYCIQYKQMNVFVLNTSIFAGQTYPGQKNAQPELEDTNLYICDESMAKLASSVSDDNKKNKINIVLAHHGTECFVEKERQKLCHWLRDQNIDLYLCGHVHKNIYRTLDNTQYTKQISCGGLFVDNYNTPSFIIGEYDYESKQISISNFHYLSSVHDWRANNSLDKPYDPKGKANWEINRFIREKKTSGNIPASKVSEGFNQDKKNVEIVSFDYASYYKGIIKASLGFDRDKEFIEIRERAKESVTILGVGMSKLSKYAMTGQHSLEELSKRVPIDLIMFDPDFLEKNEGVSDSISDFFGIPEFHKDIRQAFERLKAFCDKHNNNLQGRKKITLYTYTSIPTMSAVMIDEKTPNGEMVVEYFGYHCGQNRPLFAIKSGIPNEQEGLFSNISKQITDLLESAKEATKNNVYENKSNG